jgi:hypothetical protein
MAIENEQAIDGADKSADTPIAREDVIKEFMGSQQFIDKLNAEKGKAIKTFQEEKLPGIIQERINEELEKRNTKTPEQIREEEWNTRLKALEEERDTERKTRLLEANKNKALSSIKTKDFPLLDRLISAEEEATVSNVESFNQWLDEYTNSVKQSVVKGSNVDTGRDRSPGASGAGPGDKADKLTWLQHLQEERKNNKE